MRLSVAAEGLSAAGIEFERDGDTEIVDVVHRTSTPLRGSLFCCVPGRAVDGHDLAAGAVEAGAVALLVERRLELDVPQVTVPSVRLAMGPLAARFHGDPSRELTVVGVTGTNGKTTTVAILQSIFTAAGRRCEVLGTLTSRAEGPPTTPDAPDLQRQLAAWRDAGVEVVAMEVSSHALEMGRVDGTWFEAVAFTMLGHDHLDLHVDIDRYFAAKAKLFEPQRSRRAVIRADDPWGARLLESTTLETRPFRLADAEALALGPTGAEFVWRERPMSLPMAGRHNVANALCAATAAEWLGVDVDAIGTGLADVPPIRGRFELVDAGQDFTVAIDYAHTPDALQTVLDAAAELAATDGGRVLVVFGCGGDKDRAKRPEMGRIAAAAADLVVVTSDNPRSEPPEAIIDEILAGIDDPTRSGDGPPGIVVLPDRREAIHHAARAAREHDVVVIAGKGHETTQVFADRTIDFDDRDVVREALAP